MRVHFGAWKGSDRPEILSVSGSARIRFCRTSRHPPACEGGLPIRGGVRHPGSPNGPSSTGMFADELVPLPRVDMIRIRPTSRLDPGRACFVERFAPSHWRQRCRQKAARCVSTHLDLQVPSTQQACITGSSGQTRCMRCHVLDRLEAAASRTAHARRRLPGLYGRGASHSEKHSATPHERGVLRTLGSRQLAETAVPRRAADKSANAKSEIAVAIRLRARARVLITRQ